MIFPDIEIDSMERLSQRSLQNLQVVCNCLGNKNNQKFKLYRIMLFDYIVILKFYILRLLNL